MNTLARSSRPRLISTARSREDRHGQDEAGREMSTRSAAPTSAEKLPPRTQARGQARRREILATATSLFAARGFNSVSFADISKEVGISQAGVLHYFPTKADLLLEVLKLREEKNSEARIDYIDSGAHPLDAYVRSLRDNDAQPELVKLFVMLIAECAAPEHPGHEWFVKRNENLYQEMLVMMTDVIDEAKLPEGVTLETVTRWMVALPQGLGSKWIYDTQAFDRGGTFQLFVAMLRPYMKEA